MGRRKGKPGGSQELVRGGGHKWRAGLTGKKKGAKSLVRVVQKRKKHTKGEGLLSSEMDLNLGRRI